jgi:hypothetical protein
MIRPDYQGTLPRSKPITFAAGSPLGVDFSFLEPYRRMAAPVVRKLYIHGRFNLTASGGAFDGEDQYKILTRAFLRDRGGPLVDLHGASMRVMEQAEWQDRQVDPADLTSGSSDTARDGYWTIDFETPPDAKGERSRDSGLPLIHLLPEGGGDMILTTNSALASINLSITSGTFTVYADVVDERKREAKARRVQRDMLITAQEDNYNVGGLLRRAVVSSAIATTGYTSLAFSTYGTIDSRTLDYSDIPTHLLQKRYRERTRAKATDDEFLASTPCAIPLWEPEARQHLGRLPNVSKLHLDLNAAAPTGGRLIVDYFEPRDPELMREWLGYPTIADMMADVRKYGHVKGLGNKDTKVTSWLPELVRHMPLQIKK